MPPWLDSKMVMPRIANPLTPVRFRLQPPYFRILVLNESFKWELAVKNPSAQMVKSVDTRDLKSLAFGCAGSSPALGTILCSNAVLDSPESPLATSSRAFLLSYARLSKPTESKCICWYLKYSLDLYQQNNSCRVWRTLFKGTMMLFVASSE